MNEEIEAEIREAAERWSHSSTRTESQAAVLLLLAALDEERRINEFDRVVPTQELREELAAAVARADQAEQKLARVDELVAWADESPALEKPEWVGIFLDNLAEATMDCGSSSPGEEEMG